MKRILAAFWLLLLTATAQAAQFKGLTLAVLSSTRAVASSGGGGGGGNGVVISSDTFDRGPSSGTFLIGSTMTFDNTRSWQGLYGTARNSWSIGGSSWNGAAFVGGTVTFNNGSSQDETVLMGTNTAPIDGSSVTWQYFCPSSGTTVFGPGMRFDSSANTGYFGRFNAGTIEFYRSNTGAETSVGGCPATPGITSTGTVINWALTNSGAAAVVFTVDTSGDNIPDCTFQDASGSRITTQGSVVLRNYFSDVQTTRGIKRIYVTNPS